VRIHDGESNKLNDVYVALTDEEAKQLIDWLNELIRRAARARTGTSAKRCSCQSARAGS
jgi:hypothetical protein